MRRLAMLAALAPVLLGQTNRLSERVNPTRMTVLSGHTRPQARPEFDQGPVDPSLSLSHVLLTLKMPAQQQADLEALLDQQRDPASPNYRKWLTPEQFADRFGASRDDIAQTSAWLRSQGLTVETTARSRNWLAFSGTAAQVGQALRTQIHRFRVDGAEHYANAASPSVPSALAPVVGGFIGLDDFTPGDAQSPTKSPDGSHVLSPDDIATIYSIKPLLTSGIDGTGVRIAIIGQTDIDQSNVDTFRSRFNLPPIQLQKILFGKDPGVIAARTGEADLDLEWAGAVARNAQIVFVYSTSAFTSLAYAVDQNLAEVANFSFGSCERNFTDISISLRSMMQQANAQGMTIVAAAGDAGPAACDDWFHNPSATKGAQVSLPASIPEVTAVGGTTFKEDTGFYWAVTPDANGASALTYIPEVAWNDTAALGVLAAGGGGASAFYGKPAWQTGPGVPGGGARQIPDLSFAASSHHDGYALRNQGFWYVAGGTSVAAPVFTGVVALLNHYLVSHGTVTQPGLGNINPSLYRLAQNTTNTFHDIVAGGNSVPCAAGSPNCSAGTLGFNAATGYDLATGLGSADVNNLITQWDLRPALTSVMTLTASATTVSLADSVELRATIRPFAGNTNPAGLVTFYLPRIPDTNGVNKDVYLGSTVLNGSGGSASAALTLQASQLLARGSAGTYTVTAAYSGSDGLNPASASVDVDVTLPASGSAVAPLLTPDVAIQEPADSGGFQWFFRITLKELAGVSTTLTGLTIGGRDVTASIQGFFGTNMIPAGGQLMSSFLGYRGVQPPATLAFVFTGQDALGAKWTRQAFMTLAGPVQFPKISNGGLTNGASFAQAYAPGMLATAFGNLLAGSTDQATALPLPNNLAGATLTVNGVAAPFYFASSGQLNFQIPYETSPGIAVLNLTARYSTGQQDSFSYSFTVAPAAPGIFVGPGNMLVPYSTGKRGDTLLLFITGDGALNPPLPTGRGPDPGTPIDQLPKPVLPVKMTIGGVPADIVFAGVPPGLAGVTQVNFTIPTEAPLGTQLVIVTVGTARSAPVFLTIAP